MTTKPTAEVSDDWRKECERDFISVGGSITAYGTANKGDALLKFIEKTIHSHTTALKGRVVEDLDRRLKIQKKVLPSEYEGGYTHALQDIKEAITNII